jgi:pyrroloquinoline-quinone synthase
MSDVVARIDRLIASRRLLDHPFYVAWSQGTLTPEALRLYAAQYYQWVSAFPTWLSATHSNAPDLAMRQEILENLIDEERGADNHPELWLRFCEALGLTREDVMRTEPLAETREALVAMKDVCRAEPAVAGLAALYAYEVQQPEVMKVKREGLRDLYGVTAGHEYFTVHETLDVEHSAGERALLAARADEHDAAVLDSVGVALDATYRLLDGVERARQS